MCDFHLDACTGQTDCNVQWRLIDGQPLLLHSVFVNWPSFLKLIQVTPHLPNIKLKNLSSSFLCAGCTCYRPNNSTKAGRNQ